MLLLVCLKKLGLIRVWGGIEGVVDAVRDKLMFSIVSIRLRIAIEFNLGTFIRGPSPLEGPGGRRHQGRGALQGTAS